MTTIEAIPVEVFDISNLTIKPFTKRDHFRVKTSDVFTTSITYNKQPLKLVINDLVTNQSCVIPFLNPKTKEQMNKYAIDPNDPKRFIITVPLDTDTLWTLHEIEEYITENMKQIITYDETERTLVHI